MDAHQTTLPRALIEIERILPAAPALSLRGRAQEMCLHYVEDSIGHMPWTRRWIARERGEMDREHELLQKPLEFES